MGPARANEKAISIKNKNENSEDSFENAFLSTFKTGPTCVKRKAKRKRRSKEAVLFIKAFNKEGRRLKRLKMAEL